MKDNLKFNHTPALPSHFQGAASLGYDLVVFGIVFKPDACQSNPPFSGIYDIDFAILTSFIIKRR